ncbi:AMP-binding protein, partial [Streptomyces sp. NPDC127079]|uniref:AMP-binding protein n=1 Tax=Streptomyces sp. NPDC127079 TaxID=3347132 RepID=UPI003663FB48
MSLPLSPTSHLDTFARDHLPPADLWPVIEFTTPELACPARLNAAAELIDVPVASYGPDRPALRTPAGEVWSYGDLRTRANQVARVLTEDLGLVPGGRVLLRSPNTPWTVACWLGVLKAGGVVVTTMAALRAREIVPVAERTRPSVALVDHRCTDEIRTALPGLRLVAYGGPGADDLLARCAAKPGEFTNVDTAADDVALLGP